MTWIELVCKFSAQVTKIRIHVIVNLTIYASWLDSEGKLFYAKKCKLQNGA